MQKHFWAGYLSKLLFYTGPSAKDTLTRGNRMHLSRYIIAYLRQNASRAIFLDPFHIPYMRENKAARPPGECVRASWENPFSSLGRNAGSGKTGIFPPIIRFERIIIRSLFSLLHLVTVYFLVVAIVSQFPIVAIGSYTDKNFRSLPCAAITLCNYPWAK